MRSSLGELADRVARLEAAVDALVRVKTRRMQRVATTRHGPRMSDERLLGLVQRWSDQGREPIYERLQAEGHGVSKERVRLAVAHRDAERGRLKGGRPRVRQAHAA